MNHDNLNGMKAFMLFNRITSISFFVQSQTTIFIQY